MKDRGFLNQEAGMVTDIQVRRLMKYMQEEGQLNRAAQRAGMSEKTARKYLRSRQTPGEMMQERTWRTRPDPFGDVRDGVHEMLSANTQLEAKTIFDWLQEKYPGRFADGQLRTFQRMVKIWRATEGPSKEVFFPQKHQPGQLGQSDFTFMGTLGITIQGVPFDHLIYHFVLPYSNWEAGTVCFSESFESLSLGLQNALWTLGAVPAAHQTDRLSAAVNNLSDTAEFTERYMGLMRHYGMEPKRIQAGRGNENGDVEQRHHRFKKALDQHLMLRGSRDFSARADYEAFLETIFMRLNAGRRERLREELAAMRGLPGVRLDACKKLRVQVRSSSTIHVKHNVYSVHSRLIGEQVEVRLYADVLEVWYAQKCVEKVPRIRGNREKHRIQYRHIIDWLLRKPGAFRGYRYRDDLFPTTHFRIVYDLLKKQDSLRADRHYLEILELAAKTSEAEVETALKLLIESENAITLSSVRELVGSAVPAVPEISIDAVDLAEYDTLLENQEVA